MPNTTFGFMLLLYILPGLIGYLIYESLASVVKRDVFDKIIFSLSLTLVSALITNVLFSIPLVPNIIDSQTTNLSAILDVFVRTNLLYTSTVACIIGILFAGIRNLGVFYTIFGWFRITKRTGMIDPWHQVFSTFQRRWIMLSFSDGTKLIGWPKYYSEDGTRKELFLADATWHSPSSGEGGSKYREEEVEGEGVFVSNFDNVKSIEFYSMEGE